MTSYVEYVAKSEQLIAAGDQMLLSLAVPQSDRSSVGDDLLAAAEPGGASDFAFYAGDSASDAANARSELTAEDVFSSFLLEVQSANLLISSGLATGDQGPKGSFVPYVKDAVQQLQNTQSSVSQELAQEAASLDFAAELINSPDLTTASATFRSNSTDTLEALVKENQTVVNSIFEQLGKLDPDKVLEALKNLGDSVRGVAEAGRLIRNGIEKIRGAIDTLFRIFGKDALEQIKSKITEVWEKLRSGEYTTDALFWLFGTKATEEHIAQILARGDLQREKVDSASNEVASLMEKYRRVMNLIRSTLKAVGLAAAILGVLHVAMPWLPLLTATAYMALLASAVLVGRAYSGSSSLLAWIEGVGTIADNIVQS